MKLMDCHTHTQFSFDSDAPIHDCIMRAERLGLKAFAITDHCECNWWYPREHYGEEPQSEDFDFALDYEDSVSEVDFIKGSYSGRTELICGIEMGQGHHAPEAAANIAADKRLDFIIGSLHQIRGEWDFYYIDYSKYSEGDIYDLLERYFREIYEMCTKVDFDVLAHLTYCLRYMKQRNGIEPDISRFDDIIAESFRSLAQNGRGIEINTSGLRQGFGDCFPSLKYVKMFRDMGGEILSIGSDAHNAADIGANISEGLETARAAGFRRVAYFKERRPIFIDIT